MRLTSWLATSGWYCWAVPQRSREFWEQMDQSQNDLAESVRECYQQQMKPLVEDDELQQVREHYGIQVKD